ncbi:MAG: TIGR03560 family F420-dependent LLM class oxidoreductase, partial [Chloroflexota bacterium]|nr:TIGR03560 family F420-dependent LLM class oxidoreductase [Chloroflexota bacterium]
MLFGLDIAQQRLEFHQVLERARFAEALGFHSAWGFDHFVPMYGEGPGNCFEGMTTLAALSTATTTIRLGLLVTGVTYRHPSVLASEALTVDHASRGRLELAVGAAWYEPEHRQLGIPFPPLAERFDRLEDQLEILKRLFTGEVVSYRGRHFNLDGAQLRPTPVQRPSPPIWIGGSGRRRTLPLVARYADAWHTSSTSDYQALGRELDRLCQTIGRDPRSIVRAGSLSLSEDISQVEREAERLQRLGLEYLICGWPGQGNARVE